MRNIIYKRKKNYIVDRDVESITMKNDIINSRKSKINIVYSDTALGKSTLSEKVLGMLDDSYTKIVVKTVNQNNRNSTTEGEYFSLLFKALHKRFKNDNELSLNKFIRSNKDKQLQKELIHTYLSQWITASSKINVFFSGVYYFVQKCFGLGYFDIDDLIEKEEPSQKKIQFYYVKSILMNTACIIVFENFQNIDVQSFDKLVTCIAQTKEKQNYYIFEYTIGSNNTYSDLEDVKNYLCDCDVPIEMTQLNKLDSIYLPDLVNNHFEITKSDLDFNKNMLDFYSINSTGNLRQIIDFSFQYNKEISPLEDATLKRIWELSDLELTILITILYVNESYTKDEIIFFWSKNQISKTSLELVIKQLMEKQFITYNEQNIIVLSHASIYDIWEKYRTSEEMSKIDSLVYNNLTEAYLKVWDNETISDKGNTWELLLQLYSIYEPHKLWPLFSDLHERMFLSISPENAWRYIDAFVKCTQKDYIRYVDNYIKILNICFEFELYEPAYNLLQFLETKISMAEYPEIAIYKCMYLSALDRHVQNIEYYEKYKNFPSFTERHIFNMKLCVLSSYRSLGMKRQWDELYAEMLDNKKYFAFPEFGYLLRLSDMYFERSKALPLVKKSISFFKKNLLLHQAGKSMITASYLSAGLGKLKCANRFIDNAQKILSNKIMGQHMILVNKAAILLLSGKKDERIIHLLEDATISATVPFDKLAIVINKLAWMIANDNFTDFQLLLAQGHRYVQKEPDKHIHALFYYNVYYIYKRNGNNDNAEYYLKLTEAVKDYCLPVKERLQHSSSKNNRAVLQHAFHVCFLTYWTFDILL